MIEKLAAGLAVNRILFGLGYVIAPARTGRGWIGRMADREQTAVFTRALGGRDLVLGAGALWALRGHRGQARQWFCAHAVADATDLVATLRARDALPPSGFRFATVMAAASTAIAAAAAISLRRSY
jgi:hypothetical protein